MHRHIGHFEGQAHGPLVIAIGGIHGNEPAGVLAIGEALKILHALQTTRSDFVFKGTLIGLIGNLPAFSAGKRFIQEDLNRAWTFAKVARALATPIFQLEAESKQIRVLAATIRRIIKARQPGTVVLIDLHTTSAEGGIFCIPTDEGASLALAKGMCAPVILDLMKDIEGTVLQYAMDGRFHFQGYPQTCLGVAFEAGQHHDPSSVGRSVAAILHCLCAAGCMEATFIDKQFNALLAQPSASLPAVTRLRYVHKIKEADQFKMKPGYLNFQHLQKGEHLADDRKGPVYAPFEGYILMPLYQAQGSDGFFVVTEE